MTEPNSTTPPTLEPPTKPLQVMKYLGPGLIIAASIVGSGELIATTKVGAQAGIDLLWLIILGCVIKVFVQVELSRFTISEGETTLSALNRVPGPSLPLFRKVKTNWVMWLWLVIMITTIGQLGGIVGGVGQAFALTMPITGDYAEAIAVPSDKEFKRFIKHEEDAKNGWPELTASKVSDAEKERTKQGFADLTARIEKLDEDGAKIISLMKAGDAESLAEAKSLIDPRTLDDKYWATVVALLTSFLLYIGRYSLIQNVSTALVVTFTIITIGNVVALQSTDYALAAPDITRGLSFGLPGSTPDFDPIVTALAAFGIIGVGATELISYPYWCLEKGYARFTGKRDQTAAWENRAKGWTRVLKYDAFFSMIVYTVATIAFYLMGVSVLFNEGKDPDGMRMVSTLATAYVPVFGTYARWLFLGGAIAVLYSTFMVANAANARMVADGMQVVGILPKSESTRDKSVVVLSVVLPLMCLAVFCSGANPVTLILIAGVTQMLMLPVLGFSSIYFRYRLTDERLRPSRIWDVMLVVSSIALLIVGAYGIYSKLLT